VAKVEGMSAARTAGGKTFAAYAKEMVMDTWNWIDPVAHGFNQNFDAIPSKENAHFGYYQVNGMLSYVPAYDLLIAMGYTADKVDGGITPIEDLKIRDGFAAFIQLNLRELGGYGNGTNTSAPAPDPGTGMWDMARQVGGLLAALAMPSYNTPYYGTSGFDGTAATYTHAPFPDQALTWKQVFVDHDFTTQAYPNCRRYFNQVEGGLITAEGMFFDRPGYYSMHLMGHCFIVLATVMKIMRDHDYPYLVKSFENANTGRLVGLKGINENLDSTTAGGYGLYNQLPLINEHFPTVAETAYSNIDNGLITRQSGEGTWGNLMYDSGIWGMLWCHDNWRDYVGPSIQHNPLKNLNETRLDTWPNPFNPMTHIRIHGIQASDFDKGLVRLTVFTIQGKRVGSVSTLRHNQIEWDGHSLPSGLYFAKVTAPGVTLTKTLLLLK